MSDNQDPQFLDDDLEPIESMEECLQSLADQLNETPRRKSSLSFLTSWFFGNRDVLAVFLNVAFFGIPTLFIILGWLLGVEKYSSSDLGWVLGCFCWSLAALLMFYPYWKAYFLFKNGYFSIGVFTERGLAYQDSAGNQHYWIPTRFYKFSQPFMDFLLNPVGTYLVVAGKNPKKILVLPACPFSLADGCIGFNVIMGFYAVNVTYNTQNKTFIDKTPNIWKWIIPAATILWTLLCGYTIFFCQVNS